VQAQATEAQYDSNGCSLEHFHGLIRA
jgi:hypothetical protein